ncbi:hypothetical protein E1B28_005102 [Marasmius oreades]|uniref:DNA-directed RNA polymerase n=1 Tax=Marasmius oreades TaxID=181124 RepID=A0A9P8ADS8_9AGAR|nr:uncharacterized protein E1B28_005102 [Marasmius oreades]KAG7097783.1 hypothetical protein E1B28_005102 [Marasmius oreades]
MGRCTILKPKPLWTGKQILSLVIPRGINNIHRAPDPKSSNLVFDDGMMIDNGEIIFGIVKNGYRRCFTRWIGARRRLQRKGPRGIGIGDTIADMKTMSYITQTIAESKANVAKIIIEDHIGSSQSQAWPDHS